MLALSEIESPAATPANAFSQIQERVNAGRIPWAGPLLLVSARTVLLLITQGLLALLFFALHRPAPWRSAGDWWAVYGTVVDIGCLLGLRYFTRREGIRLRDLIGPIRMRRGHDLLLGLGYYILVFPFFLGGSYIARLWIFGSTDKTLNSYLLHMHALPVWATVYSVTLWWMIWSPTEETTYQAYAMPRLQALTGRTWIAVVIVGFFWTVQHCALPFVPDWRYLAFRFVAFLPGVLALMALYLRTRRLMPLVIAHWPMDIVAAIMTAIY
ncbi:MAG TPA: CPBP family intramembrane glutamic endopeptidase [Terracidiphilus sp.]